MRSFQNRILPQIGESDVVQVCQLEFEFRRVKLDIDIVAVIRFLLLFDPSCSAPPANSCQGGRIEPFLIS